MTCHRCKKEPGTPWHALWDCPGLEKHESSDVQKTNKFSKFFLDGAEYADCKCLWGRGILPAMEGKEYDCNFRDSGWEGKETSSKKQSTNFADLFRKCFYGGG